MAARITPPLAPVIRTRVSWLVDIYITLRVSGPPGMLHEFLVPLGTLVCSMCMCMCCLHWLCQFHKIFLETSGRLESERWLVQQCADPHFFSKMHLHTDLCFTVTNNARVGTFMLALQEFTRNSLGIRFLENAGEWGWVPRIALSWGGAVCALFLVVFGPSCFGGGARPFARRWPDCRDGHFKDA
jgi:hypothetical protein